MAETRQIRHYRWRNGCKQQSKYGSDCFHAIEVKNADKVTRHDASGLEAFYSDYPEATCTLLYRGKDTLKISDHTIALPIEPFLRGFVPSAPLPTDR